MKTRLYFLAISAVALLVMAASPISQNKLILSGQQAKVLKRSVAAGFDFFRIHRQTKDGITVTWGMTSESGVSGYSIQRTYEDPTDPYAFWEDAGSMPCSSARSYKWTDLHIYPGFISYRIVAMMNNGTSMTSDILTLHIISH